MTSSFPLIASIQVRQELAQEYEHVKDINKTLAGFKMEDHRVVGQQHGGARNVYAAPADEPNRDPDVWPPPTPVEHKYVRLNHIELAFY